MLKQMGWLFCSLALSTSIAVAKTDCSKLGSEQARQNCREHKKDNYDKSEVNCSKLSSKDGRSECRDWKYDGDGKNKSKSYEDECRRTANSNQEFQRCMAK